MHEDTKLKLEEFITLSGTWNGKNPTKKSFKEFSFYHSLTNLTDASQKENKLIFKIKKE